MTKIDQVVSNRLKEKRLESMKIQTELLNSNELELNNLISNRLKQKREALGLGLKNTAAALGISPQQMSKYENSKNILNAGKLYVLAKFLKVPIDYFFKKFDKNEDK